MASRGWPTAHRPWLSRPPDVTKELAPPAVTGGCTVRTDARQWITSPGSSAHFLSSRGGQRQAVIGLGDSPRPKALLSTGGAGHDRRYVQCAFSQPCCRRRGRGAAFACAVVSTPNTASPSSWVPAAQPHC